MTGSLHLSVYGRDESFLGHLGFSKSADVQEWSSMPFCPSYSADEVEKRVSFSGTPGLTFTVTMTQQQDVKLNIPEPVHLDQWHRSMVFQFIPPEDISKKQLDVTVISDSDVPAYLKVSKNCKEVTEENIRLVDYKGESIRLSFAKKGRITLSKVSQPPLTDSLSSWFIGIALKNATGETETNAKKTGTLTLTRSFDYSYANPLSFILVVGIFGGILATCFAVCCFKKPHLSPPCMDKRGQRLIAPNAINISPKDVFISILRLEIICKYWFGRGPKTFSYITPIVGCVLMVGAFQFVFADWYLMIHEGDRDHCYYNDFCYRVRYRDIPYNLMLSNVVYIVHAAILTFSVLWMETELFARCEKLAKAVGNGNGNANYNTFSSANSRDANNDPENGNTRSVTSAKGEASSRNLKDDQREVKAQGVSAEREGSSPPPPKGSERLPWHVLTCPNISPHLTTMTVPTPREMEPHVTVRFRAEGYKRKFSFSIGYAFAWALLFEGLFSTLYHLCPSKMNFQFDTAFMFLIAGLIVVLQHNGIELEECSPEGEAKGHVGAANFFLGFIVPLYIFNYFGSLYHSGVGLTLPVMIIFVISLVVWSILIAMWAGYRFYPKWCSCKCVWFVLALIPPIVLLPFFGEKGDFPMAFLYICIAESGCVIVYRAFKKVVKLCKDCKCDCRFFGQVVYISVFLAFMFTAVAFFITKPSTDKASTPERSRDLNHECVDATRFFDYHDLWHILSSFALLMGAHLVMYISYDPPTETEPVNNANQTRNDGTDQTTADQSQTATQNRGFQPSLTELNERKQHLHPPNQTRNDGTDQTTAGHGQMAMQNRGFQDSVTVLNEERQGFHPPNQTRNDRTDQRTAGQGQTARQNRRFQPPLTVLNEGRQGLHPPSQTRNDRTDQRTAGQGQTARQNRRLQPSLTVLNEGRQGLHPPS